MQHGRWRAALGTLNDALRCEEEAAAADAAAGGGAGGRADDGGEGERQGAMVRCELLSQMARVFLGVGDIASACKLFDAAEAGSS